MKQNINWKTLCQVCILITFWSSLLISTEQLVIKLLRSHREIQNFEMKMTEEVYTFNIR